MRIKKLWREGLTEFGSHAQERMAARGFDSNDIQHLILYGRIIDHKKPALNWRYVIAGETVDRKKGRCVVEMNSGLIIVTVY